jgi:hypothetical protein
MLGSVQPGKLRDDWSVGFMAERYCRKIVEIERGGRLTLAYVTLIGRPVIIDDVALKRSVWSPGRSQRGDHAIDDGPSRDLEQWPRCHAGASGFQRGRTGA